jgi:hypothetical protein
MREADSEEIYPYDEPRRHVLPRTRATWQRRVHRTDTGKERISELHGSAQRGQGERCLLTNQSRDTVSPDQFAFTIALNSV